MSHMKGPDCISYSRLLNLTELVNRKSIFLFGPRSTGKTTLIETQFKNAKMYDLLDDKTFQRLVRQPSLLEEENLNKNKLVIIDEIQKLPKLLDEIHRLIKKHNWRFLLTGSSVRKLRRGGANLLGGRAWESHLFPLVSAEIPDFKLDQYINRGGLPHVYGSQDYQEELESYISLYLREEILAEALVKKYEYFLRFIDVVAISNGQELNYEGLSSDAGVPARTIQNYIQILQDTLVGFELKPFLFSKKRKAISRSKFYLFDIGVTNHLAKRGRLVAGGELYGFAFEHFIILELRAYLSYRRLRQDLMYWRSTAGHEVDCIIGKKMAVEIKTTDMVSQQHLKGLRALREEKMIQKYIVVSFDSEIREVDGITIYPWKIFLKELWSGKLFSEDVLI